MADAATAGGRPDYLATIRQMGDGRLAGPGVAGRVRGPGAGPGRPDALRRGVALGRRGPAPADPRQRGPRPHALGTPEQKERILPGILRGELHFSIGYTEPSAGTDLASLQTRAERDGDEWVITGEKLFTSAIQYADFVWLAARTDPGVSKHRGLSVFLVPTDAPGFSWTPLPTMAGEFTSATFYDHVRVPAANLVGRRTADGPS